MQFLIQAAWVELEAREHGITASRRAVLRAFNKQKREAFRNEREYRRYLRTGKLTKRDLLYRVKLDMLQARISRHATSTAQGTAGEQDALDRFARDLRRKWRAKTACAPRYMIADCSRQATTRPAAQRLP